MAGRFPARRTVSGIIILVKSRTSAARAVYYVGPLIVWMAVIFGFSTDAASAENTRAGVRSILSRLAPGLAGRLTPAQVDRIDWNLRKGAHVTEYAILAILAYRAVAFGSPAFRNRNVFLPFTLCVLYAASDEYHQSFEPTRGAAAADVVFDTFGGVVGLLLCLWHRAAKEARSRETWQDEPAWDRTRAASAAAERSAVP